MKKLILVIIMLTSAFRHAHAQEELSTPTIEGDQECINANARSSQSLTILGGQFLYDDLHFYGSENTNGYFHATISHSSKTFYYPINLAAGHNIKSLTAYARLKKDRPDATVSLGIYRRPLGLGSSEEHLYFTYEDGSKAWALEKHVDARRDTMNCVAIDGKNGWITIESGYAYFVQLQIKSNDTEDNVGEIYIAGVRINYDNP